MPEGEAYAVLLTPIAAESYQGLPSTSSQAQVDSMLDALALFPRIGRTYDPLYKAVRPMIEGLLVVYAGNYGIYYTVDDAARRVAVIAIEDQRANPQARFTGRV